MKRTVCEQITYSLAPDEVRQAVRHFVQNTPYDSDGRTGVLKPDSTVEVLNDGSAIVTTLYAATVP